MIWAGCTMQHYHGTQWHKNIKNHQRNAHHDHHRHHRVFQWTELRFVVTQNILGLQSHSNQTWFSQHPNTPTEFQTNISHDQIKTMTDPVDQHLTNLAKEICLMECKDWLNIKFAMFLRESDITLSNSMVQDLEAQKKELLDLTLNNMNTICVVLISK